VAAEDLWAQSLVELSSRATRQPIVHNAKNALFYCVWRDGNANRIQQIQGPVCACCRQRSLGADQHNQWIVPDVLVNGGPARTVEVAPRLRPVRST